MEFDDKWKKENPLTWEHVKRAADGTLGHSDPSMVSEWYSAAEIMSASDDELRSIIRSHIPATRTSAISVHDLADDDTPFGFDFKMESDVNGTRRVIADPNELIKSDKLLKYIERLKHNLEAICTNFGYIDHIDCYMTSDVKELIIKECRRSKMYGKKPPVIARFDTFGNRLPDKLNLDILHGVTLHILDPEKHGFLYLSFIATGDEMTSSTVTYDDIPF